MTRNRGYTYRNAIGGADAGRTVLEHLTATYLHSSSTDWSERLARGEVELAGRRAEGGDLLRTGQELAWHRPPWDEPDAPLRFDVLHEDADVVAVSKPSGLPTMAGGGFLEHTLLALVRARFGAVHPLHRLGRFTSGIVLFARSHEAASTLARAWRGHAVLKDYRALGAGVPQWDALDITEPIGPAPHPTLGTVHAACESGRPSHSVATVVERRTAVTLFDVRITTGRPHQIRIHLAAAGYPLVGDRLYAIGGRPHPLDPGLPGDGGYLLHAHRLRCAHPDGCTELAIHAALPAGLRATREHEAASRVSSTGHSSVRRLSPVTRTPADSAAKTPWGLVSADRRQTKGG